jgi:hypothetical protein
MKGSDISLPGSEVVRTTYYCGETVETQAIELRHSIPIGSQLYDHTVKLNTQLRLSVFPVPSGANFQGIKGSDWTVNGEGAGSEYGVFYADSNGTPLDDEAYYNTVYLQLTKPDIDVEIAAAYKKADGRTLTDSLLINVADTANKIPVGSIAVEDVTLQQEGVLNAVAMVRRPTAGSIDNLTFTLSGEADGAPSISIDKTYSTVTVNAAASVPGTYTYVAHTGSDGPPLGSFKVTVTEKSTPVEAIALTHAALYLTPAALQRSAQFSRPRTPRTG